MKCLHSADHIESRKAGRSADHIEPADWPGQCQLNLLLNQLIGFKLEYLNIQTARYHLLQPRGTGSGGIPEVWRIPGEESVDY